MARPAEDVERVEPADCAAWRGWLAANHAWRSPVWLVIHKGGATDLDAAAAEALCFGWIDSLPRALDERRWMLLVSPRKPRGPWSRVNKVRIERLRGAGLMTPAGEARIAAAMADGSWDIYEVAESLEEPAELAQALAAAPVAALGLRANFPESRGR